MLSISYRLEKEGLQLELEARKKDYEDVNTKYISESNPAEKNSLKNQNKQLLEDIKRIEEEIKCLESKAEESEDVAISSMAEGLKGLAILLRPDFEKEENKTEILRFYSSSLPDRRINYQLPESIELLIRDLQGCQQTDKYSPLDKFVSNLALNSNLSSHLKEKLKEWAVKNIENHEGLFELVARKQEKQQKQAPGLLVAVSERGSEGGGRYVVEGWLIKNLTHYNANEEECASYSKQLNIDGKAEVSTDKHLSNVPQIVREWLNQCVKEYNKRIKEIHIFLPYQLMNHKVDCWKTHEEEDETIGEIYKVVIRCSERLKERNERILWWQEKGEVFKNKLTQSAAEIFTLCDSCHQEGLESKCKRDEVVAVKITTVFQEEQPGNIIWKSGLPLALWIRQEYSSIDNESELNKLTEEEGKIVKLEDIPVRVKNKRLDSINLQRREDHVGRNLCLLWDDPSLLPPKQDLTKTIL